MAVLLEDLYENTKQQYRLSLMAGADGLTNIVNWIYLAEDIGNAEFLKGGELIISTGFIAPHDENWLETLICTLIEQKASGLILNIGKYIAETDITPEVTALCNRQAFPLLTMPWKTHISDLSQDFCNRIFEDRQSGYDLASALKAVLRDETFSPNVRETLTNRLYLPEDTYALAVLEIPAETATSLLPTLRRRAAFCPSARKTDFVSFDYQKKLVLVWHNTNDASICAHLDELLAYCTADPQLQNVHAGVSHTGNGTSTAPQKHVHADLSFTAASNATAQQRKKIHSNLGSASTDSATQKNNMRTNKNQIGFGIETLKKQYARACAALVMAKTTRQPWFSFDDMGCYQILFSVSDHEILKSYYRRYIGVLEDYDNAHGGNYLTTLEAYLRCNQHLARTAEAVICHRNTVNYRINKIRDLLGVDFRDGNTKFHLQLALNIRNYLNIFKSL